MLSSVIAPLTNHLWWLVPIFIFLVVINSPWFKGWQGERLIIVGARLYLDKTIYHAVHNVTLETEDGTTQIDHIFVSKFGVFVVETKNYKGWIFGNERHATWTQKLYKHSYKFQNPIRQNYKHLKTLESALDIPFNKLKPVIVFVGDSTFKTDMPACVTYAREFARYIRSFSEVLLTSEEVSTMLFKIKSKRLKASFKTNRAHVKHLKSKFDEQNLQ